MTKNEYIDDVNFRLMEEQEPKHSFAGNTKECNGNFGISEELVDTEQDVSCKARSSSAMIELADDVDTEQDVSCKARKCVDRFALSDDVVETEQNPISSKMVHLQGNYRTLLGSALKTAAYLQGIKNVLFIDAENCFDDAYLSDFLNVNPMLLKDLMVGFPKTAFDFAYLTCNKLEKQILVDNIKVIFVSAVELLIQDEESKFLVAGALERLNDLSSRYGLTTVVLSYGAEESNQEVLDELKSMALQTVSARAAKEVNANAA